MQKYIHLDRISASLQTRANIDEDTVASYLEDMKNGDKFPPAHVFSDGTTMVYLLADGYHRYHASKRAGFVDLLCEVHEGGKLEALKFALRSNISNGLRRTNADKRRCVEIALKEFADQSNRVLAEMCCVSDMMVADMRAQLQESCSSSTPATRTGKDGRKRKVPILRKKKKKAKAEKATQVQNDNAPSDITSDVEKNGPPTTEDAFNNSCAAIRQLVISVDTEYPERTQDLVIFLRGVIKFISHE